MCPRQIESCEIIEKEFDVFFASIGYNRVTDAVGSSPDFKNADYLNSAKKFSVELKILDKDYFHDGGLVDRLHMIVAAPKSIDEKGLGLYTIKFPDFNREGRADTIEEPLRRLLKKANRQLRQTNEKLFDKMGHGLVIFALNMTTAINPFVIRDLIHKLVSREFRSISGVMICTPKVAIPVEGEPSRLFLHTHDADAPSSVLEEIYRIGDEWCAFANNGGHGDEDDLDKINSITPSIGQFPS